MTDDTAVKVVVRIRPQISRDILDLCHVCTKTIPNEPQIWIGNDKSYTFDKVFDMPTPQDNIFESCVKDLVDGCFDGYNATVLAYGQTGSGKTYTMGTGFDHSFQHDERGIIPRAVEHLFQKIEEIQQKERDRGCTPPEFKVNAQFMELYNEEVIDLLDTSRDLDNKKRTHIRIHEDADGKIYTHGVIAQCVTNVQEALHCLKIGSLSRTTASTGMNTQSSRSHAIFTLHIKQQRVVKLGKSIAGEDTCNSSLHKHSESLNEFETLTAKFHFVDLAGSERLKRTGATGDRQKESICINSGLLALGNVISALGDKAKKATHVPYRDSKLTRLLQDSLGGNSRTLMIACVSPSDRDFVETLSTLKYANRAKNIRNKVIANKDKSSQTINALIKQVESLQMELMEFKQGKRLVREDGVECINDMYHENTMLQSENNSLKTRIKALQETIDRLTSKNAALLVEKQSGEWIINGDGSKSDISAVIQGYVTEIESLRAKLIEYEEACALLRKSAVKALPHCGFSPTSTVAITGHYDIRIDTSQSVSEVLEEARKNVKRLKRKEKKLKGQEKESGIPSDEEKETAEEAENYEETQDEDSSSGSDTEKIDQDEKLSENLAEITCDISLKEKLIKQLEISQKRLHNMRQHYEEKIAQLQTKIMETEKERDKIISNLSKTAESKSEERRIRADYEKKISSLRNDVKNFENAKKHHVQLMTSASSSEAQLKKLKQEVAEMKRTKVNLLNKMKEESKKFRDSEQKRNKEIAQLKKEKLNKDSQIKALEAEKKRKEIVLKKRTEEILNLRKRTVKYVSPKTISRFKPGPFQLKNAKQRWQNLEKKISKLVLNKQNIAAIEKDMDRWLKEREKIGRCLDKISRKRDRALIEQRPPKVIEEFDDEIESLKANIEYIHENLSECQSAITGLEEAKEQISPEDIINTLNNMQLEESYYIIEKIVHMAIDQSFQNSQKEVIIKELESQLAQVIESNAVQEQLLFHVVQQANEHLAGFVELNSPNESDNSSNDSRSGSPSPDDSMPCFSRQSTFMSDKPRDRRKARNIAATTEQLLFSSAEPPIAPSSQINDDIFISNAIVGEPNDLLPSINTNGDLNNKSISYVVLPSLRGDGYNFENPDPPEEKMPIISKFKPVVPDNAFQKSHLVPAYVVEGHDQAVLCVECTDDVLFSSSSDKSVKIWDLATKTEIQKLNHADVIKKVCYCEYTRRAFTASSFEVTLWDVRQNPAIYNQMFRVSDLDQCLSSEHLISDIALNQYGTLLYITSARSVRMWDLRMLQCLGALDVGYGSNTSCIGVSDIEFEKNRIVCATHKTIKVYEVKEDSCGIHPPKFTLSLSYGDVEALTVCENILLSSCQDMSIQKWDLDRRSIEYNVNQAHNDVVSSLNVLPDRNTFITGCKSGYLKLWTLDRCNCYEEIKAHNSSVNSISYNSNFIFTASSDNTIGVWTMRSGRMWT
ncbi:kinesin-like protein KIF21A [Trichonephila inaurata madagascariensis]|uniref:Kinesin-like protein KIF21A n=1 Tax=Trichonephila inaurata madagascariensis TaxID=2747483 RepID=A0A8X6ICD3_9ARAC|nr:kinesin-like protein KIF21A [Trichonephila inaurata madagascariensis]